MTIVAIQGQPGSFHEEAAYKLVDDKDTVVLPCQSFADMFTVLLDCEADCAVIATENTIHGKITEVAQLFEVFKPKVKKDLWLPTRMCLIGAPGAKLMDVTDIYSQQIALNQCQKFFGKSLPDAIQHDYYDTAASAMLVAKKRDKTMAAIASKAAAEHYDLPILAEGIQDRADNKTRFSLITF